MRAGNGDRPAQPHQFAQHFGAMDNWQKAFACGDQFRVVLFDRGRNHQNGRIRHILGGLAAHHRNTLGAQTAYIGIFRQIAALHIITKLKQNLGNAAHPDAANAGEMHGADGKGKFAHAAFLSSSVTRPISSAQSAIAVAASVAARLRAA